jgi:hypothetical protein
MKKNIYPELKTKEKSKQTSRTGCVAQELACLASLRP